MKKLRKILTLCIAIFMVMQIVLPTLSQAIYTVRLNIQHERPYSDDNGDGTVGNDIYTLIRRAVQTIFKIGEQDENGNLSFNVAYYCLRAGLGFGSTEEILENGVDYTKLADLSNAEIIMNYFRETLNINLESLTDEQLAKNYNSICWIVDNMYLPKHENATEMKTELLQKVQKYAEEKEMLNLGESMLIADSLLTDDDIEAIQQVAIWYFTNYDENGEDNSLSLEDTVDLANLLRINGTEASNDTEESYNKNRAKQMNILYRYFIDTAKTAVRVTPVAEELELDKTLKPSIQEKQINKNLNAYVVGPFKINEKVKGNIEYKFTSTLKYKTTSEDADWSTLTIDNEMGTVYLSNAEGTAIENRTKNVKDMIAGEEFYVTILKDVLDITEIAEFGLDINYASHYYETTAEVLVATAEDQPVLKVEKTRKEPKGEDSVVIKPSEPKIKKFDLALRKYISNIERKGTALNFESRVPAVDTTPLMQGEETAKYTHPKNPLTVKQNDIITYKLRVYNEGELDGYAAEITDYIPEGLGLLVGYSGNNNWKIDTTDIQTKPLVGENGIYKTEDSLKTGILKNEDLSEITVVTGKNGTLKIKDYLTLEDKLIKKYGAEVEDGDLFQTSTNSEEDGLFYQEIEVTCIVLASNTYEGTITNIAEISKDKAVEIDDNGNETEVDIDDRDSTPDNANLNDYELKEENSTYQEDDDDYEPVQLKYFDLALRKFITGVNNDEVNTRIPEVKIDDEGNITYEHTKEPVEVIDNDNVTYTIRVFNEGTIAGYAEEIEDDIPEGLIFLPENEVNKEYNWKMYYRDEEGNLVETEDVEKAEVIRTDYLSEAKGTVNEETGVNTNLLKEFNNKTMETPDYRDVKVVFKVSQKDIPEENEDGIIINKAHITKDSDDDEDSIPDEWNDGEDDQDIEKVKVQKFDLALFKWVTQTIVTVDGKTTTTETGFKPNIGLTEQSGEEYRNNEEAEPIAAVTIDKKKLNSTVVKFVYNIKVVNEGDIEGYATELTDYIPEGLKFVAEDNPLWTLEEDGKITTRALETKLLKPGESAEVPVTFTWINGEDNLGLKTNIAAITEDYNEKGVPDEDSTPGNEDIPNYDKEQEDDDDFALVILTLKTGKAVSYIWLGIVVIAILSAGTISIKKYVL